MLDTTSRFLLGLACLLLLTRAAGLVARRAGQPSILAELAVGVLLGPSLCGALFPSLHRLLFGPQVLPALDGLAQLGLVLYALQVGRMLAAPAHPGADGRSVAAVSMVSFVASMAAGGLLAVGLDGRFAGSRSTATAYTLFLGCSLSITAVPVLARLLQDTGLTDTPAGRLSLAAAAVGDAAAWCVLAAALVASGATGPGTLLVAVAVVLAVVAVLRWYQGAAPPGEARGDAPDSASPSRAQDLTVLVAGCVLAAGASAAAGLHQLLGALLFGYLWARRRPGPDPALDGLGGIAATVLMPCFFLGFGQRLDLGAVAWTWRFGGLVCVLLAAAVLVKAVACGAAGALRGLPPQQWLRLGVLMNSRGLTEIVVLSVGYDAGLIDRTLLTALTVVALTTTAMAGPALRALDRLRPPAGPGVPPQVKSGTADSS